MYEQNQIQQQWLESLIADVGGVAGTVHVQRDADLYLTAAHNIPPPVVSIVARVPNGKGMAGQAQILRVPVQTCNLQTDQTGNIKPGARAVDAQAAIALPVFNGADGVYGVVGIAWSDERQLNAEEEQSLMARAAALPK